MSKSHLFKRRHFSPTIILRCVRWYCRYALGYREVEELTQERGLRVDHSTVYRWMLVSISKDLKADTLVSVALSCSRLQLKNYD